MNKYVVLAITVIIVAFFWSFINKTSGTGGTSIAPTEAKKRLVNEKGIILLDVRTREEYLEKHIPGSILIPVDILEKEAAGKLPNKDAEIFIYCRSGNRSATAAGILSKMGYIHVYDLGGIINWPYETESGAR